MHPILSSQQHNGLIASIDVERNEIQRFRSCFTCAFNCDITTSASARFFFLVYSLMCVFMCTCVHINNAKMHASRGLFMHAAVCAASALTSQPWPTPALTVLIPHQCTQPVVATVDQHICSPTLTPSGRRQAGPASLYYSQRSGCSFTLMKTELCTLHIHKDSIFHSMHDYTKAFFFFLSLFPVVNTLLKLLICMQKHFLFVPTCCMLLCIRKNGKKQTKTHF